MPTYKKESSDVLASWVFGGLLLFVIIAIIFILPEPTKFQENGVRFLMALAAAFLSYFFVGKILFKGKIAAQVVSATGGFALFILILFFWNPSDIRTYVADVAPSLLRGDTVVKDAQKALADKGFYKGPISGKPNTQTRDAIRSFQKSTNQVQNGYVQGDTKSLLLRQR